MLVDVVAEVCVGVGVAQCPVRQTPEQLSRPTKGMAGAAPFASGDPVPTLASAGQLCFAQLRRERSSCNQNPG